MSGPGPRGALLATVGTLAAMLAALRTVALQPASLLVGNHDSEAPAHAAALAAAWAGMTRHGPFVLADNPLLPGQVTGAMYEPLTALLGWPLFLLGGQGTGGFSLAWNGLHALAFLLPAWGTWLWARAWWGERDPDAWGAGLAVVLVACSPWIGLMPEVGRTEALFFPLYAVHGGLLLHAARRGGRAWLWGALSAAPMVWTHGYGAVFFAVAEPFVAAWALWVACNRRQAIAGLAGTALVAGFAAAPMWMALRAQPYLGIVDARDPHGLAVDLRVMAGISGDLLHETVGYEVAPYAGGVLLLAAVLAAVLRREARLPALLGLAFLAVSAGPHPLLGAHVLTGPAALLQSIPGPTAMVNGWIRFVALAIPVLAVAAAGLALRRPVLACALAVVALGEVEHLRPAPHAWTLDPEPAEVALRALGIRPLVVPLDALQRARALLGDRAVLESWTDGNDLVEYLGVAIPVEPTLHRGNRAERSWTRAALDEQLQALRSRGVNGLLLRTTSVPSTAATVGVEAVSRLLGPSRIAHRAPWWPLDDPDRWPRIDPVSPPTDDSAPRIGRPVEDPTVRRPIPQGDGDGPKAPPLP